MTWFNNLKIRQRLLLSFGLMLMLLLGLSLGADRKLAEINAASSEIADNWLPSVAHVSDMNTNTSDIRIAVWRHVAATDVALMAGYEKSIDVLTKTLQDHLKAYAPLVGSPEEQALLDRFNDTWKSYTTMQDQVLAMSRGNKDEVAAALLNGDSQKLFDQASADLLALVKFNQDHGLQASTHADEVYVHARWMLLALTVAAGMIGVVAALSLSASISRPIAHALRSAQHIAGGDLTQAVNSTRRDEIGQLLNAMGDMQASLSRMVSEVRHSSENIATGSAQIATGNADLSQRTEEQASNLQETAASMEELNATVRTSADTARQAAQLATSACGAAARGGEVVGQVVSTMNDITTSSRKISEIIGVIDSIAFQTNILALNAAVEAARAGEQGRGFAVVAGEVRTLAQRSADAAREIKVLIGASVERVEAGSRLVGTAGGQMTDIVGQVQRVSDLISEISAAAIEQTTGIGQVNSAVTQLDQATQQNAALVEESAAAADSLTQQAHRLVELVSAFRLPESAPTSFNAPLAPPAHQVSAQRVIAQARAAAPMASVAPPSLAAARPATRTDASPIPPRPQPPTSPPPSPAPGGGADDWTSF